MRRVRDELPQGACVGHINAAGEHALWQSGQRRLVDVAGGDARAFGKESINDGTADAGGAASGNVGSEMTMATTTPTKSTNKAKILLVDDHPVLRRGVAELINGEQTALVGYNYQDTVPGLDTMVTFSSTAFTEENPEVLENYDAAIEEALQFAQENPDRVRETIVSFLNMPEEVATDLRLEEFDAEVDRDELETLAELMLKYDVIETEANLDEIVQAD